MANYSTFLENTIENSSIGTNKQQFSFTSVASGTSNTISHTEDLENTRVIQILKLVPGSTNLNNTSLDFDLADEGQFIQEDSVSGTEFVSGTIKLYNNASLVEITSKDNNDIQATWPNPDVVLGAGDVVISQTQTLGDFDITFTGSTWNTNFGHFIIGLVHPTENKWITAGLVELCQYPEYSAGGVFRRRHHGGYSYNDSNIGGGTHTFRVWRSGNSVYASIDGNFTSNLYTASGDVRVGIHFQKSSSNVSNTTSIAGGIYSGNANYTTTPKYITTSDENHIDMGIINIINSCTITNSQPAGTSIKGLVSFDGRSTWSKWNGSSWIDSGITDLSAQTIVDTPADSMYSLIINSDNTANNSTIFTDSSVNNHVITKYGDAKHITTTEWLGSISAINFTSTGYLSLPDSSLWSIGVGHTIEFDIKLNTIPSYGVVMSHTQDPNNRFLLYITDSRIKVFARKSTGTMLNLDSGITLQTGIRYHIALVKNGNAWTFFIDGVNVASYTTDYSYVDLGGLWYIGYQTPEVPSGYMNCELNSIKISQQALYTSNFTPDVALTKGTTGIGNTITEIQTGLTNLTKTGETYLDFAFDLVTADSSTTPSIDQITLNYDEVGMYYVANNEFNIDLLNTTSTRIKRISGSTSNIKVNIII